MTEGWGQGPWGSMGWGGVTAAAMPEGAFILRRLDETRSIVLVDFGALLNDEPYGFGVRDFDIGGVPVDVTYGTQEGIDAVEVFSATAQRATFGGTLVIKYPDVETGIGYIRTLGQALLESGIWEWRPPGVADSVFIRQLPSNLPPLFQGSALDLRLALQSNTVVAAPFEFNRQPALERAIQLAAATGTLSNTSRILAVQNNGNVSAFCRVTIAPTSGTAKLVRTRIGVRARGNLTEYTSRGPHFAIHTGTLYNATTTVALADSLDGSVARTAIGSDTGSMLRRWRYVITPTDETSLIGSYRAYAVIRGSVDQIATVQLKSGLSDDTGAAPSAGPTIPLDFNDETAQTLAPVDMGIVNYAQIGSDFLFEGWAASDTVDATLDWDALILMPADWALTTIEESGMRSTVTAQDIYDVNDLAKPNHLDLPSTDAADDAGANPDSGTTVIGTAGVVGTGDNPNRTDEARGTKPNAGFTLPVGRHMVWCRPLLQNKDKAVKTIGRLRVRRIDGTPTDVVTAKFTTQETEWSQRKAVVQFDVTSTTAKYQYQEVFTADRDPTGGGAARRKVFLSRINHAFLRAVSSPDMVLCDSTPVAYVRHSGGSLRPLVMDGVLSIPPGFSRLVFDFGTIPNIGMDTRDARDPLAKETYSPQYAVQVDLIERLMPH